MENRQESPLGALFPQRRQLAVLFADEIYMTRAAENHNSTSSEAELCIEIPLKYSIMICSLLFHKLEALDAGNSETSIRLSVNGLLTEWEKGWNLHAFSMYHNYIDGGADIDSLCVVYVVIERARLDILVSQHLEQVCIPFFRKCATFLTSTRNTSRLIQDPQHQNRSYCYLSMSLPPSS